MSFEPCGRGQQLLPAAPTDVDSGGDRERGGGDRGGGGGERGGGDREDARHAALLLRAGAGDRAAFAEIYRVFAPRMFGVAIRLIRDRHLAEEVTQEAMLQAWTQASRFDPTRGRPLTWLMQLVHGRAVDRIRAHTAAVARDHQHYQRQTGGAADEVANTVIGQQERAVVQDALQVLPDRQREVIELAYFGGLSHSEIASRLKVPLGTVKWRIRDALKRMAAGCLVLRTAEI